MLRHHLLGHPIDFGGGDIYKVDHIDIPCGIIDYQHFGLEYPQGTAIIFSKILFDRMMKDILYSGKKMDRKVIDDVAIGLFIRDNYPSIEIYKIKKGLFVTNLPYNENIVFYRNKNDKREYDLKNMDKIISKLLEKSRRDQEI